MKPFLMLLLIVSTGLVPRLCRADTDDPARPTAVETVNVPIASPQLFAQMAPYQNWRGAKFAGWAPNGKGILIRTRFGDAVQLHRVLKPGGRREQITFFSEPTSGRFVPDKTSEKVLLSMGRGGNERDQIYLLEPEQYRVTMLTDGESRYTLGPIAADGSKMILRGNQRNGRDMDVYVADIGHSPSLQRIQQVTDEYWYGSHWSPDGQELLMRRHVSVAESEPAIYDFRTGKTSMLPRPSKEPACYNNLRFSRDPRTLTMTTDAFSEFRELVRFDRKTGKYERLTADIPWDVSLVATHRASGRLAFTVNRAGVSDLYLLDAAGQRAQPTLPPWAIVKGLRFSPDGSQLGFTLQSPTAPADVYSLAVGDSGNNRLQRWTYSVVGGLNPQSFTLPTLETIPSFDGQQVAAFQYRPAAASPTNPVPVVISLHGGPESQYHPYFSPHIQYLVGQQGYAVLCPNVRGSTGYGKTFTSLDDGPRREDSVRDIGAILDWIAKQPELDAKRVVVRGRSYGGYLVLASLARYGDRLCAGVDVAGLTDFQSFLKHTEAYRRARRRIEYGDERDPSTQVFFERIAPINNIKQIRSPLLVVHGANDPRVPFREATRLVERLSALDRDIWAVFVHDEGHQLSKHLNVNYALGVETMFLNRQFEKKNPSPSSLQRTAAEHPSTKSESGS